MDNVKNLSIKQLKKDVNDMVDNSGDTMQATKLIINYFGEDTVTDSFEDMEILTKDVIIMGLKSQIKDEVDDIDDVNVDTELLVDLTHKLDEVVNDNALYFDYSTDFTNIEPIEKSDLLDVIWDLEGGY